MEESRWRRYLRFWGADPRADVEDELAFHLAERARLNEARGLAPEEARRAAERQFGDIERIRGACLSEYEQGERRAVLQERVGELLRDFRHAIRSLARAPMYTFPAGLALALGVGANTAVFSGVSAVLLRPLPYAAPERVVAVHNRWEGEAEAGLSPAEYLDLAERTRAFAAHGVYARAFANIVHGDAAERVPALAATPSVFAALGVEAVAGRVFTRAEGIPGGPPVALLTHEYWQRRFNGARAVLGSDLLINGVQVTVVGVLPPGVRLPATYADAEPPAVIVPYAVDRASVSARGSHFLSGVARLAPGWTVESANVEVRRVAQEMVRTYPDDYPARMRFETYLRPIHADVVGDVRPLLLLLAGAVAMVLLIVCANVSGLVLTRAEDRRRELAVRSALGAGRWRIARQLLLEHLVLAAVAGVAGLGLAQLALTALVALQPPDIPRLDEIRIDGRALGFLVVVSLAATLVAALAPLRLAASPHAPLREAGTRTTATRSSQRLRRGLIAAEVALSVVLLAGAGLLLRSFANLLAVDPGYRTERVLTVPVALPGADYPDDEARRRFYARLVAEAALLPGVVAAGAVSNLPLEASVGDLGIQIEGRETGVGDLSRRLDWQVVTPGWFEAMGVPLIRGRGIEPSDDERGVGVVVLSESAARKYWPQGDAIGRRFRLGGGAGPGVVTVVGIVHDVRQNAVAEVPPAVMYLPHAQFRFWNDGTAVTSMRLVLHTAGEPFATLAPMRELVRRLDPDVPLGTVRSMEQVFGTAIAQPRFTTSVLIGFALLALGLAMIGIYGLVAYAVARRTREIAVRMALGAQPRAVARQMVGEAMMPVLLGATFGLALAVGMTRALEGMLYDIPPNDPVTLAAALLVLTTTALVACLVPARRATRIAPLAALREE